MTGAIAPSAILYDPRAGQYRDASGRFVRREKVLIAVEQENARTQIRLQALTRSLISGNLSLPEWEMQFARDLKNAHLRLAMLAAGGKERMTQAHYGAVGYELKRQYAFLDKFAHDLAAGKLTPKQAIARASSYGQSGKIAFHRAEKIARKREGFNVAKRLLDPQAQHCNSCIAHQRSQWIPIDQIVEPGTRCECQNNCRCRVIYQKIFRTVGDSTGLLP